MISKPMKHNKNADALLFLLLFTKSQREIRKKNEKTFLANAGVLKGEKLRIPCIIYHNIYRIPKITFQ